jgi:glucosyl-3-phosphoglycerate synthase
MPAFSDPAVAAWFERRTLYDPPSSEAALRLKRERGLTVGVCLPALNEAATVGTICSTVVDSLVPEGFVDQLVVVDSGSDDDTAAVAEAAGATVFKAADLVPAAAPLAQPGKGESLWKSLSVMTTDIVVWLDSDTRNFDSHFVTSLVAPLVTEADLVFTKAFYDRPLDAGDSVLSMGGARVTEISIRPLINLLCPELAGFIQPLSGEYAGRREVLLDLPFGTGYDVDLLMLIELVERAGLGGLAQVDLGSRIHRNRDIPALGRMSFEIVRMLLGRLEEGGRLKLADALPEILVQFSDMDGPRRVSSYRETSVPRPPMRSFFER